LLLAFFLPSFHPSFLPSRCCHRCIRCIIMFVCPPAAATRLYTVSRPMDEYKHQEPNNIVQLYQSTTTCTFAIVLPIRLVGLHFILISPAIRFLGQDKLKGVWFASVQRIGRDQTLDGLCIALSAQHITALHLCTLKLLHCIAHCNVQYCMYCTFP
jgi:hypothetical protein